jgi:PTS system mannose-specific IIC component/fructoselysine and glucoselysine-specific PTS system IIC component
VAGLFLGDFTTGVIMGASLEAIFMGVSAIGGSIPADATSASIVAVAYVVLTGGDTESGLAVSLPIGVVMAQFAALFTPVWSLTVPYWEKLAVSGKIKSFLVQNLAFTLVQNLPQCIMMYFGIAFGVEGLQTGLSALPAWVMTGLGASSSMMVAVGFAILCSMIWSGRLSVFFFAGFVMAKVIGMDSLSIAIIGAAVAATMFFGDKDFIDFKNSLSTQTAADANDNEEDFF